MTGPRTPLAAAQPPVAAGGRGGAARGSGGHQGTRDGQTDRRADHANGDTSAGPEACAACGYVPGWVSPRRNAPCQHGAQQPGAQRLGATNTTPIGAN